MVSDPLMTKAEVMAYLNLSESTVDRMVKDGRLQAQRVGQRVIRFRRADVEKAVLPVEGSAYRGEQGDERGKRGRNDE